MCSLLLTSALIAVWKIPFLYWVLGWSVVDVPSANERALRNFPGLCTSRKGSQYTLVVDILVVVILGILSALVVPVMLDKTTERGTFDFVHPTSEKYGLQLSAFTPLFYAGGREAISWRHVLTTRDFGRTRLLALSGFCVHALSGGSLDSFWKRTNRNQTD